MTQGQTMTDSLRTWVMVVLTVTFLCLYILALFGWITASSDTALLTHIEPIMFVIIGYYFGRMPGQQNEKTLKDEIGRQTEKTDHAQQEKDKVQKHAAALEQKVKGVRAALASAAPGVPLTEFAPTLSRTPDAAPAAALSHAVVAALNVLDA
jgi:hypothetical protein